MPDRFDRIASGVLAVAAVCIAVTFARREFWEKAPPRVVHTTPKAPDRVPNWDELLKTGFIFGDTAARIKVVEFADFECPFCRKFDRTFRSVKSQFGDDVALVFIHFPLETIHRFAAPAARAAECANDQGRFEAFHKAIYDKQDSLGLKAWISYAREAGVRDTSAFLRCNARAGLPQRVSSGIALANRLDIHATPTVVINGWRFYTPPSDSILRSVIAGVLVGKEPPAALRSSKD